MSLDLPSIKRSLYNILSHCTPAWLCFTEISWECTEIHIIDDISEKTIELDIELCVKVTI